MYEQYKWLGNTEKKIYVKILQSIENLEDSVSFMKISDLKMMERILTAVKYDHPELFYIDFQKIICLCTAFSTTYQIRYIVRKTQIELLKKHLSVWVETVKSEISFREAESPVIVSRNIHNYLIRHVKYNYRALQSPDAFPEAFSLMGVFKYEEAVCEGIAKAFKYLCNQMNVENVIIAGISSQEGFGNRIPHAWNLVKLYKNYFHVDVTWDLGLSWNSKTFRYDYCMIPDKWIKQDHEFQSNITCDDETESYFYQQKALINSSASLGLFFDTMIQNRNVIYFKIIGEKDFPNDISLRIQQLLKAKITQAHIVLYEITMVHNESQNIYFFKFKRSYECGK